MTSVSRKQREKKENERQSRIRLNRRLDALRPEMSSRGRHKMAENTPTVFDVVGHFYLTTISLVFCFYIFPSPTMQKEPLS